VEIVLVKRDNVGAGLQKKLMSQQGKSAKKIFLSQQGGKKNNVAAGVQKKNFNVTAG